MHCFALKATELAEALGEVQALRGDASSSSPTQKKGKKKNKGKGSRT